MLLAYGGLQVILQVTRMCFATFTNSHWWRPLYKNQLSLTRPRPATVALEHYNRCSSIINQILPIKFCRDDKDGKFILGKRAQHTRLTYRS